jgi:glycerol uptake facilitator protein
MEKEFFMSPYLAEFVGTFILVFLGDSVCCACSLEGAKAKGAGWVFITIGWAIAVFIPASIFGGISGGHFNPALTIGFAAGGKFPWAQVPAYAACQMLGGFCGAVFVWIFYRQHFDISDQGSQLGVFCTGPAIRSVPDNMISEILATASLVFFFFVPHPAAMDGWWAYTVILCLGISLGSTTGYALNPARDLSPRFAHFVLPIKNKGSSDWGYAWIPVAGPVIGAIVGALLGKALFG